MEEGCARAAPAEKAISRIEAFIMSFWICRVKFNDLKKKMKSGVNFQIFIHKRFLGGLSSQLSQLL